MATGYSVKVQGLDKLLSLFNKLPKQVQSELGAEIKTTSNEFRDAAKAAAPVDESRLRSSISVKKVSESEYDVVAQTFYAPYLEFGTKSKTVIPPGLEGFAAQFKGPAGQGHGNPLEAIEAWVKRKGLASKRMKGRIGRPNYRAAAWLIWRHIKRFGIKAQPYFFKQLPTAEKNLKERAANVIKKVI